MISEIITGVVVLVILIAIIVPVVKSFKEGGMPEIKKPTKKLYYDHDYYDRKENHPHLYITDEGESYVI